MGPNTTAALHQNNITTMSNLVVTQKPVNPLLAKYLESLVLRPVLTKAITNASLNFIQENLAQYLAGSKPAPYRKTGILPVDLVKANAKALKLAAYGFFISAPLSHVMMGALQKAFAGKTGPKAKVGMIVASNLLVTPVQMSVYLASLGVINGLSSVPAIIKFVRMQITTLLKISWVSNPLSLLFAQRFLSPETWVPFFSSVAFVLGTYFNTKVKKAQIAAKAKAELKKDAEEKSKGL